MKKTSFIRLITEALIGVTLLVVGSIIAIWWGVAILNFIWS